MDRRMIINAAHPEECRIAIVEDGAGLVELEIESNVGRKLKGNIYRAKISRIEPSLQAAFVDIGTSRNGFLQINDIHPSYFRGNEHGGDRVHPSSVRIRDVLEPGQEIIVQVVKEERDLKGATLTTYLSLPGRYVVLMPGSDRGGISRKINDAEQRRRLRNLTDELEVPNGIGVIIRTAGLNRSQSDLSRDLALLLKVWEGILSQSQSAQPPALLYKESDLATRVIRDYFTPEVREILIDDEETFSKVRSFIDQVMPRYRSRIKLFSDDRPILSAFGIETAVEETFKPEVPLQSGGAIVIDSLEALVAIDVNSGKATAGSDIEDTAFRTNLEAADEIARQLKLRDLGGLIVIDFIDMISAKHRASLERRLRDAVSTDKARIEVGKLSRFGLLEMSRQRLRASLSSQSHGECPNCQGSGKIKNPELVAIEALRKIQSAVVVGHVSVVKARLAPAPAMMLLNNKKQQLAELEKKYKAQIYILADGRLRVDEYELGIESSRDSAIGAPPPAPKKPTSEPDDEERDSEEGPRTLFADEEAEERVPRAEDDADLDESDADDEAPAKAEDKA